MLARILLSSRSLMLMALFLVAGCDEGLKPPDSVSTTNGEMSGLITFTNWDFAGTVEDIRIVAFRVFPPANVVEEVLQGRAVVYPPLGSGALVEAGADSFRYSVTLAAGIYPYVVVAQRFGPNVLTDWRPVGQYDLDSNLTIPSPVTIVAGEGTSNIDIAVDFANLPPPPPQ